ncbi:hypothetical protein PIB30_029681 [Stylosanthes scabra]|uniref:Uncharacterized protein n=1 Tax=Stylosanthes scabra TaxID=79078 RepID=A0ABU6UE15_9FABA|nr:hypothetical protein [Stylosanthes scabra]
MLLLEKLPPSYLCISIYLPYLPPRPITLHVIFQAIFVLLPSKKGIDNVVDSRGPAKDALPTSMEKQRRTSSPIIQRIERKHKKQRRKLLDEEISNPGGEEGHEKRNVTQTWQEKLTLEPSTPRLEHAKTWLKRGAHQVQASKRSSPWSQAHHVRTTPKRGSNVVHTKFPWPSISLGMAQMWSPIVAPNLTTHRLGSSSLSVALFPDPSPSQVYRVMYLLSSVNSRGNDTHSPWYYLRSGALACVALKLRKDFGHQVFGKPQRHATIEDTTIKEDHQPSSNLDKTHMKKNKWGQGQKICADKPSQHHQVTEVHCPSVILDYSKKRAITKGASSKYLDPP